MRLLEVKLTKDQIEYLIKTVFEDLIHKESSHKNIPRYAVELYHELLDTKIKHEQRGKNEKDLVNTIKSIAGRL